MQAKFDMPKAIVEVQIKLLSHTMNDSISLKRVKIPLSISWLI